MFSLNISGYCNDRPLDEILAFIDQIKEIQKTKGSSYANKFFLDYTGIQTLPFVSDLEYSKSLQYNIGLIYAYLGTAKEASNYITEVGVLPAGGADFLYFDQEKIGNKLHEHQLSAAQLGMPSILITSLPKSGSASLSHTLSKLLDLPVLRFSAGIFPNFNLVNGWFGNYHHQGCITHDHFSANTFNVQLLIDNGISDIWVQIRDPRAALWSLIEMNNNLNKVDLENMKFSSLTSFDIYTEMVQWIRGWIDVSRKRLINVNFLLYSDFNNRPHEMIYRILQAYDKHPSIQSLLNEDILKYHKIEDINFNNGDDDAWREYANLQLVNDFWNYLSLDIISLLKLEK